MKYVLKKEETKMAKNKEIKTNAMRILDRMKIPYSHYTYECEEFVDGLQVADMLGLPHEKVYIVLSFIFGCGRALFSPGVLGYGKQQPERS